MNEKKIVRVREIMVPGCTLVDGMNTVAEALQYCRDNNVNTLIVRKRHEDDEYGQVLLSDIAKEVLAKDLSPERVNVYEVMVKPVLGVDPGMDIRYCARLFDRFGLSQAPVIDMGEIKGMISYDDIVLKGLL